jgi:hypothetical protein
MSADTPVIFVARNGHGANSRQPPAVEAGSERHTSYGEDILFDVPLRRIYLALMQHVWLGWTVR